MTESRGANTNPVRSFGYLIVDNHPTRTLTCWDWGEELSPLQARAIAVLTPCTTIYRGNEMDLDQIHNLDCIQGLATLPEGSVDLAFADPPFNIGYDYDVYDDRRAGDEYIAWSRKWIEGVIRVLKPAGTFWLAIGDEYAADLKVLCTRQLGLHCRSWVIWFYTFGVHCKQKFTRSHAHIFHFVKDPRAFTFNSLAVRVPSARELVYGDKRADPDGRMPDDTWMMAPVLPPEVPTKDGFVLRPQDIAERFPANSDTWCFSRVAGTFAERRGWHGCQMPEQLLGRIIRACSHEGDVVLDPFGGSGTTLAVAKKLNRRFIGFEISRKYVKNIKERLSSIQAGDTLVGPEHPVLSAPPTKAGRKLKRSKNKLDESPHQSLVPDKTPLKDFETGCLRAPLGFWLTPSPESSSSKKDAPKRSTSSQPRRASKHAG
jgi:DNA modification methylase